MHRAFGRRALGLDPDKINQCLKLTGEKTSDVGEAVLMLKLVATCLHFAEVAALAEVVDHVGDVWKLLPAVRRRTRHG